MTLFTSQHQQLRVGREHFAHGILKLTARFDLLLNFLDPFFGDALSVFFPTSHKHQGPGRMAFAFRTVASGLATAGVGEGQGTGEEVARNRELAEKFKLTLA